MLILAYPELTLSQMSAAPTCSLVFESQAGSGSPAASNSEAGHRVQELVSWL